MLQVTLIIVAVVLLTLLVSQRSRGAIVGICSSALDQTTRKNENKEKVLVFLKERDEVNNTDVREHLGVASRTVVKYMTELEKEGRIEQIGSIGRGVVYRLMSK